MRRHHFLLTTAILAVLNMLHVAQTWSACRGPEETRASLQFTRSPPKKLSPQLSLVTTSPKLMASSAARFYADAAMVNAAVAYRGEWLRGDQEKTHVASADGRDLRPLSDARAWMCTSAGGGLFESEATNVRFSPSRHAMRKLVVGHSTFALPTELCRQPVRTLDLRGGPLLWSHLLTPGYDAGCQHGLQHTPFTSVEIPNHHHDAPASSVAQCFSLCMAFRSCTAFSLIVPNGRGGGQQCQLFRCLLDRPSSHHQRSPQYMEWTPTVPFNSNSAVASNTHNNNVSQQNNDDDRFGVLHMIMDMRRLVLDPSWFRDSVHNNGDDGSSSSIAAHTSDPFASTSNKSDVAALDTSMLLILRSFGGLVWNLEQFDMPFLPAAQVVALDSVYGDVRSDFFGTVDFRVVAIDRTMHSNIIAEASLAEMNDARFSPQIDDRSDDIVCTRWQRSRLPLHEPCEGVTTLMNLLLPMTSGRAQVGGHVLRNVESFVGSTLCILAEVIVTSAPKAPQVDASVGAFAMKSVRLHRLTPIDSASGELPMYLSPYREEPVRVVHGSHCGNRDNISNDNNNNSSTVWWCLQGTLVLSASPPSENTTTSVSIPDVQWGSNIVLMMRLLPHSEGHHTSRQRATITNTTTTLEMVDSFYAKVGPFGTALFTDVMFHAASFGESFASSISSTSPVTVVAEAYLYHDGPLLKFTPSGPMLASWGMTLTELPPGYQLLDDTSAKSQILPLSAGHLAAASATPTTTPILISIAVHACPECLVQLLANIRLYAMPCAVVVHIAPTSSGGTMTATEVALSIAKEARTTSFPSQMPVYLNNRRIVTVNSQMYLHLVHLRNAAYMIHDHPIILWSHMVWMQSNERLLKGGIGDYVKKFDISVPRVVSQPHLASTVRFHQLNPRYYTLREMFNIAQSHRSLTQLRDTHRRSLLNSLTRFASPSPLSPPVFPVSMNRMFSPQAVFCEGIYFNRSIAAFLSDLVESTIDTDIQSSSDALYAAVEYVSSILLEFAIAHFNIDNERVGQRTSLLAWTRRDFFVTADDVHMIRKRQGHPPFSAKRFIRTAPAVINSSSLPLY
ncbi:Hypothetical protein, putative [Bodo saltans]|uniref:Membrane-associated protein n=1 Tax=Bodo saltans TaxID=75058 RepID=A0A0S4IHM2_BODSA|nr:Hypothetical protein, putative [Bodo saltans]|eukprot:CUE66578.1 Hypothetical protein, putative [Bodo saltans]